MSELDAFLGNLQALLNQKQADTNAPASSHVTELHDAIDAELARAARTTGVVSLRDAPVIEAFRNELTDGLIRVDTANQLLRLANEVITRMLI